MIRYLVPLLLATRPGVIVPRIRNYLRGIRLSATSVLPRPSTSANASADEGGSSAAAAAKGIKIGVAGFCWGGRYAIQLAQAASGPFGEALVDVGYTAHPSMVSVPGDLEKVALPLSIANGDDDMMMPRAKMALVKEVLGEKGNCEIVEYPGAKHGFAVKGDPNDERQADLGMRAEDQAVGWFRRWFGRGSEA